MGSVITGKAYVTDGDVLSVSGYRIRVAGIDARVHDQPAKPRHGHRIEHGKRVKSELIQAIGGEPGDTHDVVQAGARLAASSCNSTPPPKPSTAP